MKLEGSYSIPAPRELVWQQLLNPQVLAKAIPGCEKLEPNPDGSYEAELKLGLAAIKGTYRGRVEIVDLLPPQRYRMKVEAKGAGGFLKGEGTLTLAESDSGTTINYDGEAQVGGLIASVGQRLILGAARQVLSQFFEAFAKHVQTSQP